MPRGHFTPHRSTTSPCVRITLRQDPAGGNGGQSWYNALAFSSRSASPTASPAKSTTRLEPRAGRCQHAGRQAQHPSTFNNALANGNYKLDKGSSTLDQRIALPSTGLAARVTTKHSAFSKYRQRLGTLERHAAGELSPVSRDHERAGTAPTPSSRRHAGLPAR